MSRQFLHCSIAGVLFLVAIGPIGCKSAEKKVSTTEQKVFYPGPPAAPRLQFLVGFSSPEPFKQKVEKKSSFAKWVTGEKEEVRQTKDSISSPYGVTAHNGKIYVCDVGADEVHVLDVANNNYKKLDAAGKLKNPANLTIDKDGTKYLCDTRARMVFIFDANDRFIGEIGDPTRCTPMDLAIKGNQLYVVNGMAGNIEVWTKDGSLIRAFGERGRGPDQLFGATNLAIGPDGRIYVVDTFLQIVKVFNDRGQFVGTIGMPGDRPGQFARPKGIAIDDEGLVYVADAQWNVIHVFRTDGQLMMTFGSPGKEDHHFALPSALSIDKTSVETFRRYLDPNFEPAYLLVMANQFHPRNKVLLFAFGKDRTLPPQRYEIDAAAVARAEAEARRRAEEEAARQAKDGIPQPVQQP